MTNAELEQLFPLGPDSLPQPGVPQGRMEKHAHATSRIFPGTVRDYWIYVPAQYDAAQPACVTIVQDGEAHFSPERRWRIPTILDNLIHQGAIPVTIGIFINPGVIPATREGTPERHQRSFEYDSPTDRYARFLIEEILPAVATRYALRTDPDSRLILGGSSGAFCSFNAAWHRPDAFRRVFSCVGSYVGLRGGHNAAPLVRLAEPKPLRLFLEGGDDDLNVYAGDWWTANTDMLSALRYAGYEVNHAFAAKAGHNDYHGSSIFPAALRWLWQDYPQPVRAGIGSRQPITSLTTPDAGWRCVHAGQKRVWEIAANAAGEIYFTQEEDPSLYHLTAFGPIGFFTPENDNITTFAFAKTGQLYAAQAEQRRILIINPDGNLGGIIPDLVAVRLCIGPQHELYTVDRSFREIWLTKTDGHRHSLVHDVMYARAMCLTASGTQLIVGDATGSIAWQLSVAADGSLSHPEPCYQLVLPQDGLDRQMWDIAAHPKRWSFLASGSDIQVADHDGRIVGILNPPSPGTLNRVVLTGPSHDQLYVVCDGKIYHRPLRDPENLWH